MLLGLLFFSLAFADPADRVVWPSGTYVGAPYSFNFYAGYVGVGASRFFYFFAESAKSPSSDPLIVFLNGGPGCSSVAGSLRYSIVVAFFFFFFFFFLFPSENGPFQTTNGGAQITNRPTSWNLLANVLWVESPAGVGMSYTPGAGPNATYSTDDHETARNNLAFLLGWYAKFPQFRGNKLVISGESYAGTYIPTLTLEVLRYNQRAPSSPLPLKGLLIGNPCTAELIDHNSVFPLLASHSIIPETLASSIRSQCPETFRYIVDNSCCQFNYSNYPPQSSQCQASLNEMYTLFANNNLYDLYSDCASVAAGEAPCISDTDMVAFLDQPAIRVAIHAAPMSVTGAWADCTSNLNYTSNYYSLAEQVYPQIFAMAPHLDISIYSGDADACVPSTGTQLWTSQIGGAVVDPWRPWQSNGQLAGYTVGYQNLRFTTLKGIGHMARKKFSFLLFFFSDFFFFFFS
jgi:carboxypeptidase C (cathepsin A)